MNICEIKKWNKHDADQLIMSLLTTIEVITNASYDELLTKYDIDLETNYGTEENNNAQHDKIMELYQEVAKIVKSM